MELKTTSFNFTEGTERTFSQILGITREKIVDFYRDNPEKFQGAFYEDSSEKKRVITLVIYHKDYLFLKKIKNRSKQLRWILNEMRQK